MLQNYNYFPIHLFHKKHQCFHNKHKKQTHRNTMTSSWVLCAFYMSITYILKTSALRVRTKQDDKLLVFNPKASDLSAVLRRSLGGPSATIFSPYTSFSIPFQVVIIKHCKNYFCHVAEISYFSIANNFMLNNGRIF